MPYDPKTMYEDRTPPPVKDSPRSRPQVDEADVARVTAILFEMHPAIDSLTSITADVVGELAVKYAGEQAAARNMSIHWAQELAAQVETRARQILTKK